MKKTIFACVLLSVCCIAHAQDTLNKLNKMAEDRQAHERLKRAQETGTQVPRSYTTNASPSVQKEVSTHNTHVAINGGIGKRR